MHTTHSSATATTARWACEHVHTEVRGRLGLITLNRAQALNALSLEMVRSLHATLLAWRDDPAVLAVAIRGSDRHGPFGAFCAGGDIRFLRQAVLQSDPRTDDFFTEQYALDYLIHTYGKPYIAWMDGIVMGGGMGISQGAALRIVTERTRMAMPETLIGLFPDVGGGYFLSRCPGRMGEWLALTGTHVLGADSIGLGLADAYLPSGQLHAVWQALGEQPFARGQDVLEWLQAQCQPAPAASDAICHARTQADVFFQQETVAAIVAGLEAAAGNAWAAQTAAQLRQRSPLLLAVSLELVRRARQMPLDAELCMERGMMRHCLFTLHLGRAAGQTEMAEGVRALVVDKDHAPHWNPARIEDVHPDMVAPFFESPWPEPLHPLRLALHAQAAG